MRASCERHLRDLADGAARGLTFSLPHVERAIGFFRDVLRLNGGRHEGRPFELEPWQAFGVGSIFGWLAADGYRRFRTGYFEIGKGNGKSPMAAGIGLYCLVSDGEARAEVYSAATKKDQAMILFRDAVAMRDMSPDLQSRLVKSGAGERCWNLAYPKTGSWFRAISSDDGQSGPRPHCSLVDELHEHPSGLVIDMLTLGQKGRAQPLTIEITNSGFDRTTVCFDHHEYSTRVVRALPGDKDFNDQWFAYVCGLDKGDDPFTDPSCWIKANPNLGVSIEVEYLEKGVREAQGMPALASKVRRLNFCEWVGAENPWIEGPIWLRAEREGSRIEEMQACDEVVGALDLSGKNDLTALGLAARRDGLVIARCEFWTPGETAVERAAKDKVPYDVWIRDGHLHATPGRSIDYRFVAQRIKDVQEALPSFRRCCFDPYRIAYLETALDELGVELQLIPHPQGFMKAAQKRDDDGDDLPQLWMPHSIELLEQVLNEGRLAVEKNPVLTWNSASAVLEADPKNNRIFTKRKSRGRIDGIVTLAMAIGLLLEHEAEETSEPSLRWM